MSDKAECPRCNSYTSAIKRAFDVGDPCPRCVRRVIDVANSAGSTGTFEEWRVIGEPGRGWPSYDFAWSPLRNPHLGDPGEAARRFVEGIKSVGKWDDGPHLIRREVTMTEWEYVPDSP